MGLLNQKAQEHYVLSSYCLFPSFGKDQVFYMQFFRLHNLLFMTYSMT